MIDKHLIEKLVEEKLASSSNYLVDVTVQPDNVIVVEIDNDDSVCIDDCVELSRYLEDHLDRDVEDFELEVGSAGITSPASHKKISPFFNSELGTTLILSPDNLFAGVSSLVFLKLSA